MIFFNIIIYKKYVRKRMISFFLFRSSCGKYVRYLQKYYEVVSQFHALRETKENLDITYF